MLQTFEPREGCGFQGHLEVDYFCRICSPCNFNSGRVNTVVFLQILHVDRIESDRVLGVIDVLTESGETIRFICRVTMTSSIDDFACIVKVATTVVPTPWGTCVMALVLESWMLVLRQAWVMVSFLISPQPYRSMAVPRGRREQILPVHLVQCFFGEELHPSKLRCVR